MDAADYALLVLFIALILWAAASAIYALLHPGCE